MVAAWLDVRPVARMVPGHGWDVILHPPRMMVVGCDSCDYHEGPHGVGCDPHATWREEGCMGWGPHATNGMRLPAIAGGANGLMDGRDVTPATSKPLEGVEV